MDDNNQGQIWGHAGEDLSDRLRRLAWAQFELNIALARALGIGANDLWALERLRVEGPLGPVELGSRLGGMRSASATALVDRLEEAGHVERRRHPSDRRRLVVVPTEKAGEAGEKAFGPLDEKLVAAAADMTDGERAAVARYLDRVTDAINSFNEAQGIR